MRIREDDGEDLDYDFRHFRLRARVFWTTSPEFGKMTEKVLTTMSVIFDYVLGSSGRRSWSSGRRQTR
ncbi:hypothetical protein MA16_Dca009179 [Dendrobium catenatum]|uniref:Uncharacterized protein n=1 Tax=Dendrobium catenatum TaxID=906689 RepID=A0A2I0VR15_9ASPA|nr:hypothetical protein MA16_Dca009179 [Dendrobium catenatum]